MEEVTLEEAMTALVQEHGLSAVWRELRRRGGWCENCGCSFETGTHHVWGEEQGTCYLVLDEEL